MSKHRKPLSPVKMKCECPTCGAYHDALWTDTRDRPPRRERGVYYLECHSCLERVFKARRNGSAPKIGGYPT